MAFANAEYVTRRMLRGMFNNMGAGKHYNRGAVRDWMTATNNMKIAPISDHFDIRVQPRLEAKEYTFDVSNPATGSVSAGTGVKLEASDFQSFYRLTQRVQWGSGISLPVTEHELTRSFEDTIDDYMEDGNSHMANLLENRLFTTMCQGPAVVIPNSTVRPGTTLPPASQRTLNEFQFREATARLKRFGNKRGERSKLMVFCDADEEAALATDLDKFDTLPRADARKSLIRGSYGYTLGGSELIGSELVPTHRTGDFTPASAGTGITVAAAYSAARTGVTQATATGTSFTTGDTSLRALAEANALDEGVIPLTGFAASPASRTTVKYIFRKGDAFTIDDVQDVNQASRIGGIGKLKCFTVLEDVVVAARTAVAAADVFNVKVGPRPILNGVYRNLSENITAGKSITMLTGEPNKFYKQSVGWYDEGLVLLFRSPVQHLKGADGRFQPGLLVREDSLDYPNSPRVAFIAWGRGEELDQRFRKEFWFCHRSLWGWWNTVRLMGQEVSG